MKKYLVITAIAILALVGGGGLPAPAHFNHGHREHVKIHYVTIPPPRVTTIADLATPLTTPLQYSIEENGGNPYCCNNGHNYIPIWLDNGANKAVSVALIGNLGWEQNNPLEWLGQGNTYHIYDPGTGYLNYIPSTNQVVLSGYSTDTNEQFLMKDTGAGSGVNWIISRYVTEHRNDGNYYFVTAVTTNPSSALDVEGPGNGGRAVWWWDCRNCG